MSESMRRENAQQLKQPLLPNTSHMTHLPLLHRSATSTKPPANCPASASTDSVTDRVHGTCLRPLHVTGHRYFTTGEGTHLPSIMSTLHRNTPAPITQ